MHEHVISFQQNPTQNFWQNHKNPKNFLNLKPRSQKCMKKWEKERLRALTYEIELGLGWKWRGKKDFGEKRERDRDIWFCTKSGRTSKNI